MISAKEESSKVETFLKSAAVVMERTWRTLVFLWRHLRERVRARSRALVRSRETRRMGRSYTAVEVVARRAAERRSWESWVT